MTIFHENPPRKKNVSDTVELHVVSTSTRTLIFQNSRPCKQHILSDFLNWPFLGELCGRVNSTFRKLRLYGSFWTRSAAYKSPVAPEQQHVYESCFFLQQAVRPGEDPHIKTLLTTQWKVVCGSESVRRQLPLLPSSSLSVLRH